MKRPLFLSLFLSLWMLAVLVIPARAAQPTPDASGDVNQLPFSRLGWSHPVALQGPFASYQYHFYLPAAWKLDGDGAKLQLSINRYFSNLVVQQEIANVNGIIAGTLSVSLNGVRLGSFPLQDSGSLTLPMTIPAAALQTTTGEQTLSLQWDGSPSCDSNLATNVTVNSDSYFDLPHSELTDLSLDLAAFPRPFYAANSPDNAPLVILVPAQPARSELQAALAVAAAMGRVSQNQMSITLLTETQSQSPQLSQSQVIQIKKQAGTDPTQGQITLQVSPWNPQRVQMVVSGANDEALLATAAAINKTMIIPTGDPKTARVQVEKGLPPAPYKEDQPLSDLVPDGLLFSQPGSTLQTLTLTLPAGESVGADAYIDLDMNHSQLIDYLRSDVTLRINTVPLGSLRLSDVTAAGSVVRLVIPAAVLHGGANQLDIQADLIPRSVCVNPAQGGTWLHVLGDSVLHLPAASGVNALAVESGPLSHYADLFTADLNSVRVVLPENQPRVWDAAVRLAANLGAAGNQPGFPQVAFAGDAAETIFDGKPLLILGVAKQLPDPERLNSILPAPVSANLINSAGSVFQVDPQKAVGYLELAAQSSTPGSVVLVVWGNNDMGVLAAASALTNPAQQERLSGGNIAVVQDGRLAAWQAAQPISAAGQTAAIAVTAPAAAAPSAPATPIYRESWLLPAIVLSSLLVVGLVGVEIYNFIRKTR